jgi:hypothetical protein
MARQTLVDRIQARGNTRKVSEIPARPAAHLVV